MGKKKPHQRSLMDEFEALGFASSRMPSGPEHIIREDSHLSGGDFGIRALADNDSFCVYTWKPHLAVHKIKMSKDEALKLAALINRTYPLDALVRNDDEEIAS